MQGDEETLKENQAYIDEAIKNREALIEQGREAANDEAAAELRKKLAENKASEKPKIKLFGI